MRITEFAAAALMGVAVICPSCRNAGDRASSASGAPDAAAATEAGADTARARLVIQGMTCASCATTARVALERTEGVHRAEVSYDSASAMVVYDRERTAPPQFIASLKQLTGYDAAVVPTGSKRGGT